MSRSPILARSLSFLLAGSSVLALPARLGAQERSTTKQDAGALMGQARAAYYNLASRGFQRYRFQARPDWAAILGDLSRTNPAGFESAMKLFATLRFDVDVDGEGIAKVSHRPVEAPNAQAKAGLDQVYGGMDQMLTGFFQTWGPFMIRSPFSAPGQDLKVEDTGSQYKVHWVEDGTTQVDILADRTFAVTEMKVASPTFDSVIRPVFDRGPGGLVLASYQADYQEKGAAPRIRVSVLIQNRAIQGLLLPVDLDLTAWVGETRSHILMALAEPVVEKK